MPDEDLVAFQVLLPLHIYNELDNVAGRQNAFKSELVIEALAQYLNVSPEHVGRTKGRPKKYQTDKERKDEYARRRREDRALIAQKLKELRQRETPQH